MNDKKNINVLVVLLNFTMGGVPAMTMNMVRYMSANMNVHFDAVVLSEETYFDREFLQYGKIHRIVTKRGKNKITRAANVFLDDFRIAKQFKKILDENPKYDAIYAPGLTQNAAILRVAMKKGIPVRIAHGRVNAPEKEMVYLRLHRQLCCFILRKAATIKLGVTPSAFRYMFGAKCDGYVINNPVLDKRKFNIDLYKVNNRSELILLQVGNLNPRKNPIFAVEILAELLKTGIASRLIFIGAVPAGKEDYGKLLKERVQSLGAAEYVDYLPPNANVAENMANSDCLLIPSLQEGLPNVAIEAQAMGLKCFVSSDVSQDCDLGLCKFIPLEKGAKAWAGEIEKNIGCPKYSKKPAECSKYEIETVCEEYLKMFRGCKVEENDVIKKIHR